MYSYIPLVYCIITYESLERALVAPPGGALWSHRCSRSVQLWTELCEDQICQLQSQMNALQLNTVWINTFPQTRTHRLEAVFPHSAGRETHPLIRSRRGSTGTVDGMQRGQRGRCRRCAWCWILSQSFRTSDREHQGCSRHACQR